MLNEVYRRGYQEFTEMLSQMAQMDATEYKQALAKVQEFFQAEILSLAVEELPVEIAGKVKSYQTEIHKQLRLLATDVMFLGVSRMPATVQERVEQVRERIKLLVGYCQGVLNLTTNV